MKRKSLLFLLLIALFAPLAMNAQQTNTLLTEGFENMTSFSTSYSSTGWYAYNAGNGNNWDIRKQGDNNYDTWPAYNGTHVAHVHFNANYAANCYLVSAPFTVDANMTELSVSLYERTGSYTEILEVFFIKASDVTTLAGVTSATHYNAIASTSYDNTDYTQVSGSVTSSALAGQSVRVVFHCTSAKDQYFLNVDDITVTETISGGGSGSANCEDFESYASSANNAISNSSGTVPSGWGVSGNTGNYRPHLYNGSYSIDGVGIVFTSGSNYGGTDSYLYSNIILHEGDVVSFNTFTEGSTTSTTRAMYYGYWKNNAFQSLGTATCIKYSEATDATQGVTTFTVPAAANGYPLAWNWNNTSSYWSAVIDNVCVTTSSNLHVTVWTETDQHTAWGTVQIGSETPGTNVETYVEEGTQITVTATPDECHTFARWIQNGGGNDITQNPATITVNDDLDLQAVFTAITYNVTATPNNSSYGSVSGGGNNLGCGSSCTLTATANTGYGFMGWQLNGNIVSTDNPYTITVNANAAYTAVFEQVSEHTITVTQATGGTISANPTTAYMGDVITLSASPETGYFLVEWIVEDASHNPITVTNNQFTMPNSDVTVTATFTQGFHVTLNQTPNGTISADQTTNLQPGDIVTLTATPDNGCVFLAWYVYKTGNPRDVIAVVNNSWFFMPSSDVTVQAVFVTEEQHDQTVGGGDATSTVLPTEVYYNYSLSQQIYTAAELVYNGRITAIAFKANSNSVNARNLEVYMAHTDKTAFSSNTDWEVMGSIAKVFTGSVSFSGSDWTTITLDTPFEYDGTSNLIICVADRTGDWESRINFNTYATNADRALCIAEDGTDYGANVGYAQTLAGYSGTLLTSNNQIKFTIKTPGSAESLTVSPDAINDFSYVEGQGPSQTHKLDIVGVDLENNISLSAPTNFEICLTEDGTYESSLTIPRATSKRGRNVTTWDFEGSMEGWTTIDADGDNHNWVLGSASTEVYCVSNPFANGAGYNGSSDGLVTASYSNYLGVMYPDNWIVSPQVTLGGSFSMWTKPYQVQYPNEHFGIYVSTSTDPTDLTSYIMLSEWTMANTNWAQYSVDLSAFAGRTGYIAVRHFNCHDVYVMLADNFVLDTDAAISVEMPVTMTLETVFVRMKANLNRGNYSGTLTASAGTGNNVNGSVSLSGVVETPSYDIILRPNPIDGGTITGAGTYTDGSSVTVSVIAQRPYTFINWTENGTVVSTDASYTFTVNGDRTLTANFGFIKQITGYGTSTGNYYLIASPIGNVEPTKVTNMIPADPEVQGYDLYSFDPTQTNEWVNYKPGTGSSNPGFNLKPGKGYLYANQQDVTLVFSGSAYTGSGEVTLTKAADAPGLDFPDWNLVGNPFAVTAWLEGNRGFYTMTPDCRFWVSVESDEIEAMEGIFVVAATSGETLTFTTTDPNTDPNTEGKRSMFALNLSHGRNLIDRAIVRLDGGRQLPKLQFIQGSTKVYIPVDGQDYAIVSCEEMGEMPVSFKAEENGSYTLSLSSEEVSFAYLHLIDNLTGKEVDLLETPSYSFEAKTTDYANRFKLVFATGDNSNDDTFAFFSNGSFVINNDGAATLQVIDVTGRILSSESINGCTNVNVNAAPGVYMLRLINGSNVKVQKVVVR